MKKIYLFIMVGFLYSNAISNNKTNQFSSKNNSPTLLFIENKGQFADQNYDPRPDILFGGNVGHLTFHISNKGISYQLYRTDEFEEVHDIKTGKKRIMEIKKTIYRTDLIWLNANTSPVIQTGAPELGYNNYYLAQCPLGALNVKSYMDVSLKEIYKGIDVHYYEKNKELKYDYIVAPYSDFSQIKLKIEGSTLILNEDGSLILETPLGKIREAAPIVYQKGKQLKAKYIINDNIVSFNIEGYNPRYELTIDPGVRLWGTYYGGTGNDFANSTCNDGIGNIYLCGYTTSNVGTFIATSGSHQTTFGGGFYDAFVVKFSSSGVRQWGTYYGDLGNDSGFSICNDPSGDIYLIGATESSIFGNAIATSGAFQVNYGGGNSDAFLVKFDNNGFRIWGTFYGGLSEEVGLTVSSSISGDIYIGGQTTSDTGNTLVTSGAHQSAYGGGTHDAFLAKFNGNGARLWGTYYGGFGDDWANSLCSDGLGNLYVVGATSTYSTLAIVTPGAYQSTYGGNVSDAFIVKFNNNGSRLWGTYYGGAGGESGTAVSTDAFGNPVFVGATSSSLSTEIATLGTHQPSYGGGANDAYLAKLSSNGLRIWGSYYGGSGDDQGASVSIDTYNNIYLVGTTDSNTGTDIATTGVYQPSFSGGLSDAFLTKISGGGIRQWGTYYGGNGDDNGIASCAGINGNVFLAGWTNSLTTSGIASIGAHQTTHGGGYLDSFLAEFSGCSPTLSQPGAISGLTTMCAGSVSVIYSVAVVPGANFYVWNLPASWAGSSSSNTISALPANSGTISVMVGDTCGTSAPQNLAVTVNPQPIIIITSSSPYMCIGETVTITAGGASTYTWNNGGNSTFIIVSPISDTTFSLSGTNNLGCNGDAAFTQSVSTCDNLPFVSSSALNFHAYPNPTSGIINIVTEQSSGNIEVYNNLGQCIRIMKTTDGTFELDLQHQPKGVYFIRLGKMAYKVIKD